MSDSQVAIKALNKPRISSQLLLTALEQMEILASQVKHLTLDWIKTHVGTEGNKQADQTAKECINPHKKCWAIWSGINKKTAIPWQIAKNKIEEYAINKWTCKWNFDSQYKHTKVYLIKAKQSIY